MNNLFYPAAIWVDNFPVTDMGRAPVQFARDERSVIVETSTGKRKRYVKAIKHKFTLSWEWLPDDSTQTIDGGYAHTKIKELFGEQSGVVTIRFYDRNANWTEYVCFVNSYAETLMKRDPSTGTFLWAVQLELEEQ